MKKYYPKAVRRRQILDAAIALAEKLGYQNITREEIAKKVGIAPGLVSHCFSNMEMLRNEIVYAAIASGNCKVLAQALAARDPYARYAPDEMRARAAATLLT